MFEVIVQSQPEDTQSLEILKEAYAKLNREKEIVHTSKRIAEAYVALGQLSSAILEYESVLQKYPNDPDVQQALAEIENRANKLTGGPILAPVATSGDTTSIIDRSGLKKPGDAKSLAGDFDDGRQSMLKLFVDAKLISANDFNAYWPAINPHEVPTKPSDPFIQILHDKSVMQTDKAVKFLCERTRLCYIPLERYDVDVELARTFSRDACLRWCVLPFDRMSKTVLVATANPFNKAAIRELEASNKVRFQMYMVSPIELTKTLKKVFR